MKQLTGKIYKNSVEYSLPIPDSSGQVQYSDFEYDTKTGTSSLTISNLTTVFTPTEDFSLVAGTLMPGMQYMVRVTTGATAYTMTLGTGVTNPFGEDLTLTANKTTTLVFLATSNSTLELFNARTAN